MRNPDHAARLSRILSGALRVWDVKGTVSVDGADALLIATGDGARVGVRHDDAEGWTIVLRDPASGAEVPLARHAGLPGLLRSLRAELAPDAPAGRLLIAQ